MKPNTRTLIQLIFIVVIGIVWIWFANFVVPSLLTSAHRGEGIGFMNDFFRSQKPRPLELYLEYWNNYVPAVLFLWIGFGVLLIIVGRPEFQSWWEKKKGAVPEAYPEASMGRGRSMFVLTFSGVLIGFSMLDIVLGIDHWPFAAYIMYADVQVIRRHPEAMRYRFSGVPADDPSQEVPIQYEMLAPLNASRVYSSIQRFGRMKDPQPVFREGFEDILTRYEIMRVKGEHQGPKLAMLRVYEEFWPELKPFAEDIGTPTRRTLVCEVTLNENK